MFLAVSSILNLKRKLQFVSFHLFLVFATFSNRQLYCTAEYHCRRGKIMHSNSNTVDFFLFFLLGQQVLWLQGHRGTFKTNTKILKMQACQAVTCLLLKHSLTLFKSFESSDLLCSENLRASLPLNLTEGIFLSGWLKVLHKWCDTLPVILWAPPWHRVNNFSS